MRTGRILKFQQIADSRFTPNIEKEIRRLKEGTCKALNELPGVHYEYSDQGLLDWKDGTYQRRYTFWVTKDRQVTWNDIYSAINKVKAVPYDFVKPFRISSVSHS